jgi:lipopolysaccharide export system protein LptC
MSVTTGHNPALGADGRGPASGRTRLRALRRAARHSTRVRVLRMLLPVTGIALIVAIVLSNLGLFDTPAAVQVGRIVLQDGALKMENPRLSGYTNDARAYELGAVSATQDIADPQTVRLEGVRARIAETEGGFISLEARQGTFHTGDEVLKLKGDIVVKSDQGYEMRLDEARVEMSNAAIISDSPVEIDMLNGQLRARDMRIDEHGSRVLFGGPVALRFLPAGSGDTQ